jgi:hypothetical protein
MSKKLNSCLLCGAVALFTAAKPVSAQTPPNLGLRLFAGLSARGTNRCRMHPKASTGAVGCAETFGTRLRVAARAKHLNATQMTN